MEFLGTSVYSSRAAFYSSLSLLVTHLNTYTSRMLTYLFLIIICLCLDEIEHMNF